MDSSTRDDKRPEGGDQHSIIPALEEGRKQFLALVDHVRPDLHRYCARMTGSVADGEDVVQDTLARAYYQLPELRELPPLGPWLFRIAHNLAIDHWRREQYRQSEPLEEALEIADDVEHEPANVLAQNQAVRAAISSFLALVPAQRACVILKDVLDHSLDEIAGQLDLSLPAVKAALHRGRTLLRERAEAERSAPPARTHSRDLARYANLFNARDWDGVRSMLADDVKLDLVSRRKSAGWRDVSSYFTNYGGVSDWHLVPAWLDGREVLAVLPEASAAQPGYFIELVLSEGEVVSIRDFRFVPYIGHEAAIELPTSAA